MVTTAYHVEYRHTFNVFKILVTKSRIINQFTMRSYQYCTIKKTKLMAFINKLINLLSLILFLTVTLAAIGNALL